MTAPAPDMDGRGRAAAAGLRQAVTVAPPELSRLVRSSRVRRVGRVALGLAALVVLAAITFGVTSVGATDGLRWLTGAVLGLLVIATWVLCAHAGGHAHLVPLPALALAVLWALTVSGHGDVAWWLVAMSAAAAAGGVIIGTTAIRQSLRGNWLDAGVVRDLRGMSGTAVTPLGPVGVVRVAAETWTAVSLSGSLPVGAAVHVVRVNGVRLEVWSEEGTVPFNEGREEEQT